MSSPEQKKDAETPTQQKTSGIKTIFAIVLMLLVGYFAKSYLQKNPDNAQQGGAPQQEAPSVVLHILKQADLATNREYIGRVESIQTVQLKPQVPGQIAQVHFKEGSTVKAGQVLFTLDTKQYQATVDLRKAQLTEAQANLGRASKYYERLNASDKRSVSASDLDVAQSDVLQGKAAVEQAKASLRLAEIDLGYTKITAPIAGRIGKAAFTKGNYVTSAGGALAEIVQTDPIRIAYALPDKDYLDQMDAFRTSGNSVYEASLRLANGRSYTPKGERDFEDNAMDEKTGTIMMRLRFKNDQGILVPGSMVRVTTKPIESHVVVLMPQEAVLSDLEGDYVYVVDSADVAHKRRVVLGPEVGIMCEALEGVEAGERIVLRGTQSVRPEMKVNPAPQKAEGDPKTPAELAMESTYDAETLPVSPDRAPSAAEGKM